MRRPDPRPVLRRAVLRRWRARLQRAAIDATADLPERALVLAPHPDDETLGCGATVRRWIDAGVDVMVVVATDGRYSHSSARIGPDELAEIRAAEFVAATQALGIGPERRRQLGLPEGSLLADPDRIAGAIAELLASHRPDRVLVSSGLDWHPDHIGLRDATVAAAAESGWEGDVWEYPVWWLVDGDRIPGTAGSPFAEPEIPPGLLSVRTGGFLDAKRTALSAHRSQTTNLTGEDGWAVLGAAASVLTGAFEYFVPSQISTTPVGEMAERFDDDRPAGGVVGSVGTAGRRHGVDAEGIIGIDHGALRIGTPEVPGWGREGVVSEPVALTAGAVARVEAMNGHNTSQTFYLPETPRQMLRRKVSEVPRGVLRRPRHHESFAAGLFAGADTANPDESPATFVMAAGTGVNGILRVRGSGGCDQAVIHGVPNVPISYVLVRRRDDVLFCVGTSVPIRGFATLPLVRPVASAPVAGVVDGHLGVAQRIQGEVGYRVDTRVYGWSSGTGTAPDAVADPLTGSGPPVDGRWRAHDAVLTPAGVRPVAASATLESSPATPGLLLATMELSAGGVEWSFTDESGRTSVLRIDPESVRLEPSAGSPVEAPGPGTGRTRMQLLFEERSRVYLALDGVTVFGEPPAEIGRLGSSVDIRVRIGEGSAVRDVELLPEAFDPGTEAAPMPAPAADRNTVWTEDFAAIADGDLGDAPDWERTFGEGTMRVAGDDLVVVADVDSPNPGRTFYTRAVPPAPEPLRVELDLTPPGDGPGAGHLGRGGIVLWGDADNHVVLNIWLDETFPGTSMSSFYRLDGHEDMYEAVWTNCGRRMTWGVPFTMGVDFDGQVLSVDIDHEVVLVRALRDVRSDFTRPLVVERVGPVVNWEWGDDTGTTFHEMRVMR